MQGMICKVWLLQLQKKHMEKKNVTKKHMCAILLAAFGVSIKETNYNKADLFEMLEEKVEKSSNVAIKNLIVETNDNLL